MSITLTQGNSTITFDKVSDLREYLGESSGDNVPTVAEVIAEAPKESTRKAPKAKASNGVAIDASCYADRWPVGKVLCEFYQVKPGKGITKRLREATRQDRLREDGPAMTLAELAESLTHKPKASNGVRKAVEHKRAGHPERTFSIKSGRKEYAITTKAHTVYLAKKAVAKAIGKTDTTLPATVVKQIEAVYAK